MEFGTQDILDAMIDEAKASSDASADRRLDEGWCLKVKVCGRGITSWFIDKGNDVFEEVPTCEAVRWVEEDLL